MQPLTNWTDELLACDDDRPPDALYDRVVALGERARERLVEFATDPEFRGSAADGGGFAPLNALEILAALPPDAGTAARLVASISADPGAVEVDDLIECLVAMGDVAAPSLVEALAQTRDPEAAGAFAETLSRGDPIGEASFGALMSAFERFPGDVAPAVSNAGDARAIPALRAALAARFVGAGSSLDADQGTIAIAEAIEHLDGELTPEEAAKRDLALIREAKKLRRSDPLPASVDEATRLPPGRILPNDPCPCGSGRKYKKCHEGGDGF